MDGVFIEGMEVPRSCSECYIREKNSCPLLKTYVSDWGKPLKCPIRRREEKWMPYERPEPWKGVGEDNEQ